MTVHTAQYSLIKRGKLFNSIVGNIRVRPAVMPNGSIMTYTVDYVILSE